MAGSNSARLDYLDGVRAVAALYVVAFHAVLGFAGDRLSGPWRLLRGVFGFGHEAVAVFIVLSGYCLMLPVARSAQGTLKHGLLAYFARRAFRILPPYFATLALTLAAVALLPALNQDGTGTIWDDSLPALAAAPIVSHLLLVHNWLPGQAYSVNGPLWSVATEWQIYFCFPVLLVLWRRLGLTATFVISALVGYLPLWLFRSGAMTAIPWYLALFVLGMAAAAINFSSSRREARLLPSLSSPLAALALWGLCLGFGLGAPRVWFRFKPLTDLLVGAATALLLVFLTQAVRAEKGSALGKLALRVLQWRPVQWVGHFSYSLYLTHLPVVALCFFALEPRGLSAPALVLSTLALSAPVSVLFAYAFHLAVERKFMRLPAALAARLEPNPPG